VLQWLRRWWERDRHLARQRSLDPADPLEELIRVVNEAQDRDAETNVGFMIPISASGEGDLNNHYDGSASRSIYQHLCRLIVKKRPVGLGPHDIIAAVAPNSVRISEWQHRILALIATH
jgi:hypothetical protein